MAGGGGRGWWGLSLFQHWSPTLKPSHSRLQHQNLGGSPPSQCSLYFLEYLVLIPQFCPQIHHWSSQMTRNHIATQTPNPSRPTPTTTTTTFLLGLTWLVWSESEKKTARLRNNKQAPNEKNVRKRRSKRRRRRAGGRGGRRKGRRMKRTSRRRRRRRTC